MVIADISSPDRKVLSVGIVGLGSRGLGVLERLLALAPKVAPLCVEINIFEPGELGCGVHRTDQPEWLLLNTVSCQLSVFPDSTAINADGREGPDFYTWCVMRDLRHNNDGYISPGEGRLVLPTDFLPRRLLGEYLGWAYKYITARLPSNVRLNVLQESAVSIDAVGSGRCFRLFGDAGSKVDVDRLFLNVGHTGKVDVASAQQECSITSVYPLPQSVSAIAPDQVVLIEGFGLAAMDVLAALTKGRGGRFVRDNNELRYQQSGFEPQILLYSRSGLPFRARPFARADRVRHRPLFLTGVYLEKLRMRGNARQLDFELDLFPLLLAEMRAAFYLATSKKVRSSNLQQAFKFGRLDHEFDALEKQFGKFEPLEHLPRILPVLSDSEYQKWVRAFIATDLEQSKLGLAFSPLKVALEVWRDLRDVLREAVNGAGLIIDSRQQFYSRFAPLINRTVAGPQLERNEELLALIDGGHVSMAHRQLLASPQSDMSQVIPVIVDIQPSTQRISWRISASVPSSGLYRTHSLLLKDLHNKGLIRPLTDQRGLDGVEVDADGHPLDVHGHSMVNLWMAGPAVEGSSYYNHYVPSAGAWSRALSDAHRAASSCLGFPSQASTETYTSLERMI